MPPGSSLQLAVRTEVRTEPTLQSAVRTEVPPEHSLLVCGEMERHRHETGGVGVGIKASKTSNSKIYSIDLFNKGSVERGMCLFVSRKSVARFGKYWKIGMFGCMSRKTLQKSHFLYPLQ